MLNQTGTWLNKLQEFKISHASKVQKSKQVDKFEDEVNQLVEQLEKSSKDRFKISALIDNIQVQINEEETFLKKDLDNSMVGDSNNAEQVKHIVKIESDVEKMEEKVNKFMDGIEQQKK